MVSYTACNTLDGEKSRMKLRPVAVLNPKTPHKSPYSAPLVSYADTVLEFQSGSAIQPSGRFDYSASSDAASAIATISRGMSGPAGL